MSDSDTEEDDGAPTIVASRTFALPPPAGGRDRTVAEPSLRKVAIPSQPPLSADTITEHFEERYTKGETLGVGGMGEVRLSVDRRIGRSVAMKLIKAENVRVPKLRARFLFEAKVQGQLEHPAIVPVYDIGTRADGVEYFTMKRVHGRTLHEILRALAGGDKRTQVAYSRRRLLLAFQSACLAIEYAHQRGVIHRDLKPANLMLGSLGELSLLDWGLAKVSRADRSITPTPEAEAALDAARASEATAVGEILGTPGYMAPEQAAGGMDVDVRSDVFALGAMLFEILTLKHLIPGKTGAEIGRATLIGAYDARISERFPDLDVAPELEEACVKATAHDKNQRLGSAMELHNAIERFLEGDRDVQRRRNLAGVHVRSAIAALAELSDAKTPEAARDGRGRASREVMRALAIDPENPTALRTFMRLMTEGSGPATPEAEAAAREIESSSRLKVARRGTWAYLAAGATILAAAFLGVRNLAAIGASVGFFLGAAAFAAIAAARPGLTDRRWMVISIIGLSSAAITMSAWLFGPFMYLPSLCAANVLVFCAGVDRRSRTVALVLGALAIIVPFAAEELGIVATSTRALGDHLEILSRAIEFPAVPTKLVLLAQALGTVILPAFLVGAERDARAKAERRLAIQAHQLAEFVPSEVKPTNIR